MKASRHPYLVMFLALLWPIMVTLFFTGLIILAVQHTGEELKQNGGLKHVLEELWYGKPTPAPYR